MYIVKCNFYALLLGLLLSISAGKSSALVFDPCEDGNEKHLHDMHRRFKNYKTLFENRKEEMVCDKYLIPQHGAWFMSYNDMPTEPPTFLDCGTTHPIWLNGTLPTMSDEIVERTACKVGFSSYCDEEIPVRIKRCEKYTAYFLLPPKHCPEAYCFGIKKDPQLPKPVIKVSIYNENDSSVDRLQFECNMNISTLNFAYYEVTWRWAESTLTLKNESSRFSFLTLTDEHFKTLGVDVTCTVKGLHFEHDTIGSNATSDKFYAGIKISESATVTKGGTVKVQYHLTIPIGCNTDEMCGININVIQTDSSKIDVCAGQLHDIQKVNGTVDIVAQGWNLSHYIEFKHIGRKGYGVNPSSFAFTFQIDLSKTVFTKYEKNHKLHVSVHDSQWDHKICSAQNDPHMTTFDGLIYEHQQPGTYLLYEHAVGERHMQVQMELTPCNSNRAYCICGLAVRAGGDIFVIYLCGGKTIIQYATCFDDILLVKRAKRNTKQYKLTFPTGTEISTEIYMHGSYGGTMNVNIRGSGDDNEQSQGLCGRMSGNKLQNLLIRGTNKTHHTSGTSWQKYNTFSDSWKVKPNENLFYWPEDKEVEKWADVMFNPRQNKNDYCKNDRTFDSIPAESCSINNTLTIPKRPPATPLPTPTGAHVNWNMSAAKQYCSKTIKQTDAFKECEAVKDVNWDHFYDMCWHDIQLTDSTMWAKQTVYALLKTCTDACNQYNTTGTLNNTTAILEHLCPDNCNSHGKCEEATCVCNDQFLGIDCSVSITDPPAITSIFGLQYGGRTWCDKSKSNCHTFRLSGHEIEQTDGITCKIEKFLVKSHISYEHISEIIVSAAVQSLAEVRCTLINEKITNNSGLYVEEFRVSVSYNKQNYSNPVKLHVFDGHCHDIHRITSTTFFSLMNSTCFIDGKCTEQGVTHNEFMMCNPEVNQLSWTFDFKHNCKIQGRIYHQRQKNNTEVCLACNPEISSTIWTVKENCLIDNVCYPDLLNSPIDDIYICNSSSSTSEWSLNQTIPVPDIKVHVVVSGTYELECYLNTSRMNYTYFTVSWKWENNSLELHNSSDKLPHMRLPGYSISNIGINVSCIIEGQYELNKIVTTFTSNEFYVGVQTDNRIEIEKGGEALIGYHLTVPLPCEDCSFHLRIKDIVSVGYINNGNCDSDIVSHGGCEAYINSRNWNVSKQLPIKHRTNRQYGIRLDTFLLKLEASVTVNSRWKTVQVQDVMVKVVQRETEWHSKVCSAYTDPHMTTFDGLHYEHQFKGTYTMYRNTVGQRNMEVQIQLTSCYNDKVYCPCGIAVRAGADVFVINFCDGWSTIQYVACEHTPVLQVSKMKDNNQHYRIVFPTGTEVSVNIAHVSPVNFLDVEIRPSADDYNMTDGLCGTLTNQCADDFRLRSGIVKSTTQSCHNNLYSLSNAEFSASWKVSSENDLLQLQSQSNLSIWYYPEHYCKCTTDENDTSIGSPIETCSIQLYPSLYCVDSGYESFETVCRRNVKPNQHTKIIPVRKVKAPVTKPSHVALTYNLTKEEAYKHCENNYQRYHSAFDLCSPIQNIPSQHFIEICALDIFLSHTLLWVENTREIMKYRCLHEIHLNKTVQTGKAKNGKTFREVFETYLCPGHHTCSGHGQCKNGVCFCKSGFMSSDCSVRTSIVPTIHHLQNNGLCDVTQESCRQILVFGPRFYETNQVYCQVQVFYMFTQKTTKYGSTYKVLGKYISLVEIQCNLPIEALIEHQYTTYVVKGYTVSIGHSRSYFSPQSLKYFEFDSKCQMAKGTEEHRYFETVNGTCFIDGHCYKNKDFNPNNTFEYCDSLRSKQEWTFNDTSTCKIDGQYVLTTEVTKNFQCQSCDPKKSVYNWTITDENCFIESVCYTTNSPNPVNNDEFCNPTNSQTRWTFNESALVPHVKPGLLKVHQNSMNVDVERLYFECVIDLSRLSYTSYKITWQWGGNLSLSLENSVDNMDQLWLREDHFKTLGTIVTCTLQGKNSVHDQSGTTFISQQFFAGVVIAETLSIQKGGTAELTYHLTVPFGCLSSNGRIFPCFIELNMLSPEYAEDNKCYGDIVNLQHCRIKIWRDEWNISRKLSIKHRGRQMYGVFPEHISMKLKTSSADHPIWDTTKIPEVQVHVNDNQFDLQERVCSAYNAHITSFDGVHYEHQYEGTFTMYHSKVKERYMMVQVKQTLCDERSGLYCICGVAVRAGADVYILNFCDGNSIMQYITCQQQLLDITAKSKDNKRYKITFPTGTEVSINIKYIDLKTFMDVEIRASDDDFDKTEGLCGILNGPCDDDLTKQDSTALPVICPSVLPIISQEMSDYWRISGNSSDLFNLRDGSKIAKWTDHDEYCSCPSAEISNNFECSARSIVPCNRKNDYITIGQSTCHLNPVDNFVLPNRTRSQQISPSSKPEYVNMSLSEAQSRCREAIENNTAFKACSEVPNMPTDYFLQICAIEVEKSKSLIWIRHTVDSMKSRCLSEVQKNGTLSDQPSEDIPSITESVIMVICPGLPECSGNGKCVQGVCVCNDGYMSNDCSKTNTVPPEIFGIRGNGICDKNEINCDAAFVVGSRIEESGELSCKLSKYVIHPDGSKSFEGTTIVSGNAETLVEVHCPLKSPKKKRSTRDDIPFVEIFDVSVGYNKKTFSQAERVILMNSKCQQQNGTFADPTFGLKEDTCFIDSQCLLDKEVHSQNDFLYCNASISPFKWMFDESESCVVDGHYFSRNDIVFGRQCLYCNPDSTSYNWTLSMNFCFIDDACFRHEERNAGDECLICDTHNNLFGWTKHDEVCIKKVAEPTDVGTSSSNLGVILLGSIGSVVVLFIVGFIVNCYVKNKNSRLKKKTTYAADGHYDSMHLPRLNVKNCN